MNKQSLSYISLACVFVLGCLFVFFGTTINAKTMQVIENTSIAVSSGVSIQNFINPILGVIAKGYITNVPSWVAKTSVILGIFLSYISLYIGMCIYSKKPIGIFLTKSYWMYFKPVITGEQKKELSYRKRSAKK